METRLLKYALEIARQGSFTRAAEEVRIAQPSLSQQIAKLEHDLGLQLFERHRGAVTPTGDGERFLKQADRIVQLHDDLEREMAERRAGMGRELVVGTPVITGAHILPPLLAAFQTQYPHVRIQLFEDSPAQLETLTAAGRADLALLPLPITDERLTTRVLGTEAILAAWPPQPQPWIPAEIQDTLFGAGPKRPLSLESLRQVPFVLLKSGYGFRQTVLELCAESGFQPDVAYETSSIEMAQSLVAHGLGVTLVPAMVRRSPGENRPRYIRVTERPSRTLAFVYRKDRYLTLGARALIDMAPPLSDR